MFAPRDRRSGIYENGPKELKSRPKRAFQARVFFSPGSVSNPF